MPIVMSRTSGEDPFWDGSLSELVRQPSEQPCQGPPSWSSSQRPVTNRPTLTDRQHDYAAIGEQESQDSRDMELANNNGFGDKSEKPENGHGEEGREVEESGEGEEGEEGQEDKKDGVNRADGADGAGGVDGEAEEGKEGKEGGVDGEGEERSAAA